MSWWKKRSKLSLVQQNVLLCLQSGKTKTKTAQQCQTCNSQYRIHVDKKKMDI